jgi:chorismate dehydratase
MLYSNLPVEKLNNKKIFLTGESSTSIVLFKILTAYFYNINVNFTNNQKDSSAAVLIGDKALYHYYNDKYPYKYDLGRAWYEMTSLPFVFGLWIINTNLKINEDELNRFIKKLLDIKQDSKKNLAALIEHYSFKGLTPYQIIDYWETINYDLTDEHIQGLNLFYEYAKMIGEIKKIPELKEIKVTNKYELFMIETGDNAIKWEFSFYYQDFGKLNTTGAIRRTLSSKYRLIEMIQKKAHLRGISLFTPTLEQQVGQDD